LHVVDRNHLAAEPKHRRHEAGAGARARLIEEVGQNFALEQIGAAKALHQHPHLIRYVEDVIQLRAVKLADADNILPIKAIIRAIGSHAVHLFDFGFHQKHCSFAKINPTFYS
jgi:hypothetical protein